MEELYEALTQSKDLQLTAAILADEPTKVKEIWRLRETIAEGLKFAKSSSTYKYQYMYEVRNGNQWAHNLNVQLAFLFALARV